MRVAPSAPIAPAPPYLAAAREAVLIHEKIYPRGRTVYRDVRDERPTREVALRVALAAIPKKGDPWTAARLRALDKALADSPADEREFVGRFLAETTRRMSVLRPEHGACTWPPRDNLQSLLAVDGGAVDATAWAELRHEARDFGADPRALVALAVLRTPDSSFGEIERTPDELAELHEAFEVACAPVGTLWTRSDVRWELEDEVRGTGRLFFKEFPDVPVYPLHDCGKRVVAALASRDRKR